MNKVAQHALGDVKIADRPVLERPDRHDMAGGSALHALGVVADRQDVAGVPVHRDHRALAEHHAAALDIDHDRRSAQVDSNVLTPKHCVHLFGI